MESINNSTNARLELITSVADLAEKKVLELVNRRLQTGDNPLQIVEDCQEGLRQVGERYERREYYLAGLIMAGEIFREVMERIQPIIEFQYRGNDTGRILIGTVQGDIHDIGKNNLIMLLSSYGFTVHDLGVDVPPSEFLVQALQVQPDVIGLSGLLTSSYEAMGETIFLLRHSGTEEIKKIPIIIGGYQLNEQVCSFVGADYWVNDAMNGVRLCQELMARDRRLE
jgi:methanogenic corrinoid protein MtbC1